MTIQVTQLEIYVANEMRVDVNYMFVADFNPIALALKKHYRVRCVVFSYDLYIGGRLKVTPAIVRTKLWEYKHYGSIQPFSFDIEA